MTYEEALIDLQSIYNRHGGLYTDDSPAWELAFDAMEKQIRKKPKKTDRADIISCFNCGYLFAIDTYKFLRCCPKCGQAIDWSDENDKDG